MLWLPACLAGGRWLLVAGGELDRVCLVGGRWYLSGRQVGADGVAAREDLSLDGLVLHGELDRVGDRVHLPAADICRERLTVSFGPDGMTKGSSRRGTSSGAVTYDDDVDGEGVGEAHDVAPVRGRLCNGHMVDSDRRER